MSARRGCAVEDDAEAPRIGVVLVARHEEILRPGGLERDEQPRLLATNSQAVWHILGKRGVRAGSDLDSLVGDECGDRAVENVDCLVLARVRVDRCSSPARMRHSTTAHSPPDCSPAIFSSALEPWPDSTVRPPPGPVRTGLLKDICHSFLIVRVRATRAVEINLLAARTRMATARCTARAYVPCSWLMEATISHDGQPWPGPPTTRRKNDGTTDDHRARTAAVAGRSTAAAAVMITSATVSGRETIIACEPSASVIVAAARSASERVTYVPAALSLVATTAQAGRDFHANGPDGSEKAGSATGRCALPSQRLARPRGRRRRRRGAVQGRP